MGPIRQSFELTRRLYEEFLSKYGKESYEFTAIDNNILEIHSRILSWIRNEEGFDKIYIISLRFKLRALVGLIRSYFATLFIKDADILFFPTNETHLVQQLPVAENLLKNGVKLLFVTNKRVIKKKVPSKFRCVFLSIMVNPFSSHSFAVEPTWFPFSLKFISHLISKAETLSWMIRRITDKTRARCIILGNDLSFEGRVIGREFLARGLRVASIQHGGVDNPMHWFSFSELFFAFGEQSRKILLGHGLKEAQVVVTGAPYLSSIVHDSLGFEGILRRLGIKSAKGKRLLLVLLSGPGHSTSRTNNEKIVRFISDFIELREDIVCVLKLHKKDRHENYETIFKAIGNSNPIHIVSNVDLERSNLTVFNLIQNACCVASGASASVLESMHFRKIVFTFDFNNEYSFVDFIQSGGPIHLTDPEEALTTLDSFFKGQLDMEVVLERADKFIRSYFYQGKKPAFELISEYLVQKGGRARHIPIR